MDIGDAGHACWLDPDAQFSTPCLALLGASLLFLGQAGFLAIGVTDQPFELDPEGLAVPATFRRAGLGLLEPVSVAHLGAVAQGLQLGSALPELEVEESLAPFLMGLGRFGLGQGLGGLAQLRADPFPGALSLAHVLRPAPCRHGTVSTVMLKEVAHRGAGLIEPVQGLALFLKIAEGVRHVVEHGLIQRRQRLGQGRGQGLLVRAFGQLRLAQLDQQIEQGLVAMGTESKEQRIDPGAVLGGADVQFAPIAQRVEEPVSGQGTAVAVHQHQIAAHALGGDEEPALRCTTPGDRAHAAAQGAELRCALIVPAEFHPDVSQALLILTAEQEVPFHALAGIAVRLNARGDELPVQQERQGHGQHLGLAGPVVAAQQQIAVPKPDLLVVVVEQVHQAQAQGLPAGPQG